MIGTARSTFSRGSRVPTIRVGTVRATTTTARTSSHSSGESSSTRLMAGGNSGLRTPSSQAYGHWLGPCQLSAIASTYDPAAAATSPYGNRFLSSTLRTVGTASAVVDAENHSATGSGTCRIRAATASTANHTRLTRHSSTAMRLA